MTARAQLSRFPAAGGARLAAYLSAPGGPGDSLWGSWAVLCDDGRLVARGTGALSISACDPTLRRETGEFRPRYRLGEYRVDLAVDDRRGRRGVVHLRAEVAPPPARPVLSDLVLLCGAQAADRTGGGVRLEPGFGRHFAGERTVTVYFEVDGLALRPDGTSRFACAYALRPVDADDSAGRPPPAFEASREEENVGGFRRQSVSAPLRSLKPGPYYFEVEIRDLTTGATARAPPARRARAGPPAVALEVDPPAGVEAHALALEPQALGHVRPAARRQADRAARVDDPVPRGEALPGQGVERVADLARLAAEARERRDLAVGGHAPARDAAHHGVDALPAAGDSPARSPRRFVACLTVMPGPGRVSRCAAAAPRSACPPRACRRCGCAASPGRGGPRPPRR